MYSALAFQAPQTNLCIYWQWIAFKIKTAAVSQFAVFHSYTYYFECTSVFTQVTSTVCQEYNVCQDCALMTVETFSVQRYI